MIVEVNHKIPDGFPIFKYPGKDYFEPMEQLKTVFNLRHNVFDKLAAAPKLTYAMHADIKDIFSETDILILQNICTDNRLSTESKLFLKKIIDENRVYYNNAPYKKVQEILNLPDLPQKNQQRTYTTFSKWINVSDENMKMKKIETIINDQIFLSFPVNFNDRFDCQLHLNNEELLRLANNIENNVPMAKYLNLLTKYSIIISSFSFNQPSSTKSNHMWGLYGGNGTGIALTYELDNLLMQILKNNSSKNGDDLLFFEPVVYANDYNPCNAFKVCLDNYFGENNTASLVKFIKEFINKKTNQWQNESELRFYKICLEPYKGFPHAREKASKENCIQLEKWIEENKYLINHNCYFNRPTTITLGWDCNTEEAYIKKLIEYAHKHKIHVIKLEPYINYSQNEFYFTKILSPN